MEKERGSQEGKTLQEIADALGYKNRSSVFSLIKDKDE